MPKAPDKYFTKIFIQSHSKSLHKNRYMFKNVDTKNIIRYKYFRDFRFSMWISSEKNIVPKKKQKPISKNTLTA